MKNVSRKVLVLGILVLGIIVLGIGAFVVLQIQGNQAPSNSSASGFGVGATRDLFVPVNIAFSAKGCEEMLTMDKLRGVPGYIDGLTDANQLFISQNNSDAISAINCSYDIGNLRSFNVELVTYLQNAEIAPTSQALREKLNNRFLASILESGGTGVDGDMAYYYGPSKIEKNTCTTVIYQILNDFEFAKINYYGFGDCNAKPNDYRSKAITDIFAKYFSEIMKEIYIKNRGSVPTTAPGL